MDGDQPTGEALAQLLYEDYAAKYRKSDIQVIQIGVEFSGQTPDSGLGSVRVKRRARPYHRVRIDRAKVHRLALEHRQQLMQENELKAETRIGMIKDLLLRDNVS